MLRASKSYLAPLEKAGNIEYVWNTEIESLVADKKLTALTLFDKAANQRRELPVDGLFIAIGRVPNTALFSGQLELDPAGYVIADETTRTSVPGVFAAGDLRTKPLRQIVTAAADGAVAAKFAEEYLASL